MPSSRQREGLEIALEPTLWGCCHQEARPRRSSTPPTVPHQGLPAGPPPALPQVTRGEGGGVELAVVRTGPDEWAGTARSCGGEGKPVWVSTPKLSRPALPTLRWSGGAAPVGPGPAPGAGGRHVSEALVRLLDPSQPQSPPPRSAGPRTEGPPATGAPRRTGCAPGGPCGADTTGP